MSDNSEKKIIIIAGPNGAGKTTFAEEFLPREAACPAFINADLIAAGLIPEWQSDGYTVKLFFLQLAFRNWRSPESGSGFEKAATTFQNR